MIILTPITSASSNPFNEFPELFNLWEPDLAAIAKEATDDYITIAKEMPYADQGEILIIKNDQSKIIGITGYLPSKEDFSEFMLRWHGILPQYQGLGYSENIIKTIIDLIHTKYPNAQSLIEMLPTDKPSLKLYFNKISFIQEGPEFKLEWSDKDWQNYSLDLNQ